MKTIETARLLLRPLNLDDAEKIYQMSIEDGMKKWIPDQVYEDENHAREVLNFLISQYPKKKPMMVPIVLGIALKKDEKLIGHVGLSPLGEKVEIGYAIEDAEQGNGYATEAVSSMTDQGLLEYGISEISGVAAAENIGSRRVLEKAGYQYIEEVQKPLGEKEIIWKIYKKFKKEKL